MKTAALLTLALLCGQAHADITMAREGCYTVILTGANYNRNRCDADELEGAATGAQTARMSYDLCYKVDGDMARVRFMEAAPATTTHNFSIPLNAVLTPLPKVCKMRQSAPLIEVYLVR